MSYAYKGNNMKELIKVPLLIKITSLVWIFYGAIILITGLAITFLKGNSLETITLITMLLTSLLGFAFLYIGIKTLKGKAKDVLGNSIGSIIFGLIMVVQSIGTNNTAAIFGIILFITGALCLTSRAQYKAYIKKINA